MLSSRRSTSLELGTQKLENNNCRKARKQIAVKVRRRMKAQKDEAKCTPTTPSSSWTVGQRRELHHWRGTEWVELCWWVTPVEGWQCSLERVAIWTWDWQQAWVFRVTQLPVYHSNWMTYNCRDIQGMETWAGRKGSCNTTLSEDLTGAAAATRISLKFSGPKSEGICPVPEVPQACVVYPERPPYFYCRHEGFPSSDLLITLKL